MTECGVQAALACTEQAADKPDDEPESLGCDPQLEKLFVWRRLTPELSRAAKRRRLE